MEISQSNVNPLNLSAETKKQPKEDEHLSTDKPEVKGDKVTISNEAVTLGTGGGTTKPPPSEN